MRKRAILLVAFTAFLSTWIVRADEWPHSGSDVSNENAVSQSDAIIIGQATVDGEAASDVEATYGGVKVNVLRTLRGSAEAHIKIELTVNIMSKHEEVPKNTQSYIFFLRKNTPHHGDDFVALKILDCNDKNIAMVKKLAAQLPAK